MVYYRFKGCGRRDMEMKKGYWAAALLVVLSVLVWTHTRKAPVAAPGFVKVPGSGVQIKLEGLGRQYTVRSGQDLASIPPGRYQVKEIQLVSGAYSLQGYGLDSELVVEEGKTVELNPGPPLAIKTDVSTKGSEVSIGYQLVGRLGEEYDPAAQKNGASMAAPAIKILGEKGKVLESGTFKFG